MAVELAEDYYLVNFRHLVSFVARFYAHLLNAEELAWESRFVALPEDAQRLYVRLLCRSKTLFRVSKLKYPEISCLPSAARHLAQAGFASLDRPTELENLLPLFTRAEIIQRSALSLPRNLRRAELDSLLLAQPARAQQQTLAALLHNELLLQVQQLAIFDLYRLCFFGNLYQDMTDFVLRDLGLTRFEDYAIDGQTLAFQSRQQIDSHLQYYACVEMMDSVLTEDSRAILDLSAAMPDIGAADANLKRRVERSRNTLARQLERLGEEEAALALYRTVTRPPSRERQARILAAMGEPAQALELCTELLNRPYTDEERQFAEQFGARLAKASHREWPARPRCQPQSESLELQQQETPVELLALAHYSQYGECYYTENVLFTAVFGLVFWDIIFTPLPGVFYNPFQQAPADFYEPGFIPSRRSLLQQRWSELDEPGVLQRLALETFEAKQGLQNPMVQWRYLEAALLQQALQRIPAAHWLAVFRRLLEDPRHNRSGFPDLVLFPGQQGYCLIEVKGPGDSLQKNQLRWMDYFTRHGIPHKVVHVNWLSADTDSL